MLQGTNLRKTLRQQALLGTLGQPAESSGSGVALVKNKENRLDGRLGLRSQTCHPTTQTLNGRQESSWSGKTPNDSYYQNQAGQSAHYEQDHNVLMRSCNPAPSTRVKRGRAGAEANISSYTPLDKGSQKTHQYYQSNYNTQQGEELDFTSDDISQLGATLYEQEPVRTTTSTRPSPGPNPAGSTPTASTGSPHNTDVSVMLGLIRRALDTPTAHKEDSRSGETQQRSIKQETTRAKKRQQKLKKGVPR